ncbi:PREDICTED: uncharacterized protein LOC107073597, partial [Polistes dominula]|uniref:Uncharacterized protein LOC107073597 n=1 Tax=Polistes dominula TaxID=743375 RepID=A0ABM1JBD8_POLDO
MYRRTFFIADSFSNLKIRLLIVRFKLDHENLYDVEELNILQKYNNQSKSFVYALMFFFDVNCFLIVFPPVLNAFLYYIGILDVHQLTLPLTENNIDHILEFSVLLKSLKDKIECIIYVTGSIFTVYINSYLGQRLLNHSNAVLEELCNVPFYTLSVKSQKLLLLMIARSRKPSFLSIGNMFVSSHEVFASLYKLFTTKTIGQSTILLIQRVISLIIFNVTYSVGYFRFVTIQLLIVRFKLDHEKISDLDEMDILKKYTNQSKSCVYALMFFFDINCFLNVFPPIVNAFLYSIGILEVNQLTLPLTENNIDHVGMMYFCMLIGQSVTVLMTIVVSSITLSTFLVFIQHACCQCSIIILKIRQPFQSNQTSENKTKFFSTLTEEYNWIVDIVNRHRISIEFIKMLRNISNATYLIVMLLATIVIVVNFLCILKFSIFLKTLKDKIECIIYVTGSIFTVYITFYLGQTLLNHSNAVFEELCNVPFYTLSVNSQKLLLLMIARSGKPSFLSIGNMFVSSHEVFAS